MINHPSISILLLILIGFAMSSCCGNSDEGPIQEGLEFAIYDNAGETNLFDEDGPFSLDSLLVFQEDAITAVEFIADPSIGGIYLNPLVGNSEEGVIENTYLLHIPNGEVDTLVGVYNFFEGDKCSNSFWVFRDLFYNGLEFTERNENRLIKVLRD